ncbi:hypothetical protein B0H19DRAFT_1232425, partial [Mycena capillaripes]
MAQTAAVPFQPPHPPASKTLPSRRFLPNKNRRPTARSRRRSDSYNVDIFFTRGRETSRERALTGWFDRIGRAGIPINNASSPHLLTNAFTTPRHAAPPPQPLLAVVTSSTPSNLRLRHAAPRTNPLPPTIYPGPPPRIIPRAAPPRLHRPNPALPHHPLRCPSVPTPAPPRSIYLPPPRSNPPPRPIYATTPPHHPCAAPRRPIIPTLRFSRPLVYSTRVPPNADEARLLALPHHPCAAPTMFLRRPSIPTPPHCPAFATPLAAINAISPPPPSISLTPLPAHSSTTSIPSFAYASTKGRLYPIAPWLLHPPLLPRFCHVPATLLVNGHHQHHSATHLSSVPKFSYSSDYSTSSDINYTHHSGDALAHAGFNTFVMRGTTGVLTAALRMGCLPSAVGAEQPPPRRVLLSYHACTRTSHYRSMHELGRIPNMTPTSTGIRSTCSRCPSLTSRSHHTTTDSNSTSPSPSPHCHRRSSRAPHARPVDPNPGAGGRERNAPAATHSFP